ncbi:molybdopterin-dependent oxidoreductase [Dactylosporangium fulvum]
MTRLRFSSKLRSERATSQLGLALAAAFAICFLTGLLSHAVQHPPQWFFWPSRPVNLYRVTQGLHVATGFAVVPLVSAKLWSVYPRFFVFPPVRNAAHALERLSVAVLVSAALFELVTGILDVAHWYSPMPFAFIAAHYWTAWLVTGAILTHIAVKLPVVRRSLTAVELPERRRDRRAFLGAVAATAGVVTLATVGQTVRPLATVSVLGPRDPRRGPQRLPVNTPAAAAGVLDLIADPGYRLELSGPAGTRRFTPAELAELPQHTVTLPIACVEGWSATAVWTGIRIRDLVELAGGSVEAQVLVESLQRDSAYSSSVIAPVHVADPLSLLALKVNGEVLDADHGYPCRIITASRPGVMQTKWVARIVVGDRP